MKSNKNDPILGSSEDKLFPLPLDQVGLLRCDNHRDRELLLRIVNFDFLGRVLSEDDLVDGSRSMGYTKASFESIKAFIPLATTHLFGDEGITGLTLGVKISDVEKVREIMKCGISELIAQVTQAFLSLDDAHKLSIRYAELYRRSRESCHGYGTILARELLSFFETAVPGPSRNRLWTLGEIKLFSRLINKLYKKGLLSPDEFAVLKLTISPVREKREKVS